CRRVVHLCDHIEIARAREDEVDDPFNQEHQGAIAQRINQAAKKTQKKAGLIRTRKRPDSSKKQCHLRLIVCSAKARHARVFVRFFKFAYTRARSSRRRQEVDFREDPKFPPRLRILVTFQKIWYSKFRE